MPKPSATRAKTMADILVGAFKKRKKLDEMPKRKPPITGGPSGISTPMPKVPTPEGRPRANPLQGSSAQLQGTEPTETFMRTVRPQTLQKAIRMGTRKTKPTRLMKYL